MQILGHSTVLCFLVVKRFIVANDDQLRIAFIILHTRHFFLQKLVKFQLFLRTGGGHDPSAEYASGNKTAERLYTR